MREAMNSVVSIPAAPLREMISLKVPCGVPSRRGAVVADDVVDQRVVEHLELLECVHEPADVVVGVLEEAGVHLHLPREHRLEIVGHVVPGRDLLGPLGQLGLGRDHAELLLARERLLAQRVPALVELAPYLSDHSVGTWCGACVAPGAK